MFFRAHRRLRFDRHAAQCERAHEMNSLESKTIQKMFSPTVLIGVSRICFILSKPRLLRRGQHHGVSKGGEHSLWSRAGSEPRPRSGFVYLVELALSTAVSVLTGENFAPEPQKEVYSLVGYFLLYDDSWKPKTPVCELGRRRKAP
jgi:hypothetical protein